MSMDRVTRPSNTTKSANSLFCDSARVLLDQIEDQMVGALNALDSGTRLTGAGNSDTVGGWIDSLNTLRRLVDGHEEKRVQKVWPRGNPKADGVGQALD